jgi:uridylate kinase
MAQTYKRILLKISGESLEDKKNHTPYDPAFLERIYKVVKSITSKGTEVALVVGGGNIWRGNMAAALGIDRASGDYMGMLATIMNAMAIQSYFEEKGMVTRVMSAIPVNDCCEPYIRRKAIRHLEKKRIVIFSAGVGSPFFTTDTAAALRAKEIGADCILMGKNGVEGIYDDDPKLNPAAKFIKKITFQQLLSRNLKVMDNTAVGLLIGSPIVVRVFNMADPSNAIKVVEGSDIGTTISEK